MRGGNVPEEGEPIGRGDAGPRGDGNGPGWPLTGVRTGFLSGGGIPSSRVGAGRRRSPGGGIGAE